MDDIIAASQVSRTVSSLTCPYNQRSDGLGSRRSMLHVCATPPPLRRRAPRRRRCPVPSPLPRAPRPGPRRGKGAHTYLYTKMIKSNSTTRRNSISEGTIRSRPRPRSRSLRSILHVQYFLIILRTARGGGVRGPEVGPGRVPVPRLSVARRGPNRGTLPPQVAPR